MRLPILLALLLASCAYAQDNAADCVGLSAADAARVRNIRVTSSILQDNVQQQTMPMIRTTVQAAPGARVGSASLVGAIIGYAITDYMANSQVKRMMEEAALAFPPLLEEVKDFDFRAQFWGQLEQVLDRDSRFRVLQFSPFAAERGYIEQPDNVRGEPVDAVLDLSTVYALSPDLRVFLVRTRVLLQGRPDGRELYRCEYSFTTPPVSAGAMQTAISVWSADRGALFRAAALIGIAQSLKMLRLDLLGEDAPRPSGEEVKVSEVRVLPGVVAHGSVNGKLVDREEGFVIARDNRGYLRGTMAGETFSPPPEAVAAAGAPSGPTGPVKLDDLLGAMEEATPPPSAQPKAAPAKAEPKATRASDLDELGELLGK